MDDTSHKPHPEHQSTNLEAKDKRTSSSPGGKRAADGSIESRRGSKWAKHDHNERGRDQRGQRKKGKSMGRKEYFRDKAAKRDKEDNRDRSGDEKQKIQNVDVQGKAQPIYSTKFSRDEIASEDRRPKRKVAVLLGYSGSGYRGMQLMPDQKTIEGDLFQAFVRAGAISKANADDPKKSQLVRCARTDKGVHAAGNVISLKLIIEDPDIVQKINDQLPPQIRVWGIERTIGSFSCYTACDSRRYEYLIPTYAFLPPHPSSWMAKQLKNNAEEDGQVDAFNERQKEVLGFWEKIEAERIHPILESLDQDTRSLVEQAIYHTETAANDLLEDDTENLEIAMDEGGDVPTLPKKQSKKGYAQNARNVLDADTAGAEQQLIADATEAEKPDATESEAHVRRRRNSDPIEIAIKAIKAAYIEAKNEYRISLERLARVKDVLARYSGTHNFHNFTVKKNPKDPSARRYIRSFILDGEPVLINGTEWLSLKVHGQSFMMHQIRKMVAMVALIVRCGCPPERLTETLSLDVCSIPKAPSLGLLLERPIFDTYNTKAAEHDKNKITFSNYEKEMLEFKQREIYDQIFQVEAQDHVYHTFFAQIDNFRMPHFLYLTSRGLAASENSRALTETRTLTRKQLKVQNKLKGKLKRWDSRDDDLESLQRATEGGADRAEEESMINANNEDPSIEPAQRSS